MATSKTQRIGILVITAVMVLGTLGSFAVLMVENENARKDAKAAEEAFAEYEKAQKEREKQAKAYSDKYYASFLPYKDNPAAFDASAVGTEVKTKDLKKGSGAEIKDGTTYLAYYIGWNPKGKTFDSSFEGETLNQPVDTALMTLIPGWTEGVKGMKVGGVREITIPAEKAYGEKGMGEDIPANTPIKFIVMVIKAN